jgi:outer membrane protein OmpA-like peptidoglycan-associated protein
MNKNPIVRIAVVLLVTAMLGLLGLSYYKKSADESQQISTSGAKATKGRITCMIDSWAGYFPLNSPIMRRNMRRSGWTWDCINQKTVDYVERFEMLKRGEIQFTVATVDAYLLNAAKLNFPGVITFVIDRSNGGDAIIAWEDEIPNLDALKTFKGNIAFTPDSPSHHALKMVANDFDIPYLKNGKGLIKTDGSEDALKRFLNKEVDVAVLWEPDVSRALSKKGVVKLIGTENADWILDIFLINREFAEDHPDQAVTVIANYFRTLKHYRDNPTEQVAHLKKEYKLKESQVESMLKGVKWFSLQENASVWMGVTGGGYNDRLIDEIDSAVKVLQNYGDFDSNPLPDSDAYRLMNSSFIKTLFDGGISDVQNNRDKAETNIDPLEKRFSKLDDNGWQALQKVGTLRSINFQSGTAKLSLLDKQRLDKGVENLKRYPNYRVFVAGHTGLRGDKQANKALSLERAKSAVRYLEATYGIDPNRLKAVGMGSSKPLPKESGESARRYNGKLPRVELNLMAEMY